MFYEVVSYTSEQMLGGITATDAVIAVRVDVHIKLLVGLYQGLAVFAGIAEVNIVIGSTMHQEQLTVELVYPVHGSRGARALW